MTGMHRDAGDFGPLRTCAECAECAEQAFATKLLSTFTDARIIMTSDQQGNEGHPLAGVKLKDWPHERRLDFCAALEQWARDNWPECHQAIIGRGAKDDEYRKKCLGSVVRKRCAISVGFIWNWIDYDAPQVLRLSPYIGRFVAQGGYEIPPDTMTWDEYCRGIEVANYAFVTSPRK